ncbi:FkbM family methyltransferase [Pantoea agglomerans]|uniref:FkbM family methyltransferase n=1 Tax=Enterobacter agglomerans TaxID=549 RepID=UPI00320A0476
MKQNDIIIDVGANFGGFSLEIAERNPTYNVYAIEAEPNLAAQLNENATNNGLENHKVINCAVNEEEGDFQFYVSELGDHGTSSLLPFSQDNITHDEYWKDRNDLHHSKSVVVHAMPLEKILDEISFNNVAFIKIDVQGLDLAVLKSSGSYLNRIQAGMLEVPSVLSKSLYDNTSEDLMSALEFLKESGFSVYAVKPNDPAANEFNVFFVKNGLDYKEIEEKLNLLNFHFYDGKHFWHAPSHKLENPEQHILNLNEVVSSLSQEVESLKLKVDSVITEKEELKRALDVIETNKAVRFLKLLKLIK